MASIPLIPGVQHTYARFRRRGKRQADDADDQPQQPSRRSLKRRLISRRKLNISVKLERRYNSDRRNQQSIDKLAADSRGNLTTKGRHINTTA